VTVPISGTDSAHHLLCLTGLQDHSHITSLNIQTENLGSSRRSMIEKE